jgi:hypothetical protein
MNKLLKVAVVVLLLLIPVAILYQVVNELRDPRARNAAPPSLPKDVKNNAAPGGGGGGGGKPPKGPRGGADPAAKVGKGNKQPVAVAELPAAVKSTLEKQAADAEFSKLEKDDKGGQEIYSAKWGPKAAERELKLAADGTPLEAKEVVAFDTLPDAARTAINQAQPTAKMFECRRLATFADGNATVVYEVRGQAEGEKLPALRVSAEGAVTEAKRGKAK